MALRQSGINGQFLDLSHQRKLEEDERRQIETPLREDNAFKTPLSELANPVGRQFDAVVMNPPFQKPSSKTDRPNGNSLWPKFVEKAISLCKEDGYCAIVHPPKWRKPKHKLWPVLSKKMKYLEIHGETDGANTFGAKTRYDWYIFQNSKKCVWKTVVVDERGARHELDLAKLPFLPNRSFGEIWSILAEGDDDSLDVIHSTKHHPNGPSMSETETQEFKYPCVRSIRQGGVMSFCYSNRKSEAFVPKVILTDSRHLYPIIDMKGEYGMTHHCFGILADSPEYAQRIKEAIESERFKEIVKAAKWASFETDFRFFKLFKRDFWKTFVDEHGSRGRDGPCGPPPARIRTSGITASGSYRR